MLKRTKTEDVGKKEMLEHDLYAEFAKGKKSINKQMYRRSEE